MALGDVVLVQLGDGITTPRVTIQITELAGGQFKFDVTQATGAGAIIGDLQGIFFDVGGTNAVGTANDALLASTANSTSISGLTATGAGPQLATLASTIQDGNDSVKDLGNGNNMNGALGFNDTGAEAKGYDVGIGFGTSGIGKDDVRSVSFTFNNTIGLTIDDFIGMDFGVRMTSVGTQGGSREGSVKLTSSSFQPIADDCEDIDCVIENDSESGNVFDPEIEGAGGVTLTQTMKSYTLYDEDGAVVGSSAVDGYGTPIALPNSEGATITFNEDGSYTVNSGGDELNATDHLPFKLTYTLSQTYTDFNGHVIGQLEDTSSLKFDICGENDTPDATDDDVACLVENGVASGNVILGTATADGVEQDTGADTDIDRGDVLTVTKVTFEGTDYLPDDDGVITIDLNGDEDGGAILTMNADGTWSFAANDMYVDLAEGVHEDLVFTYTVTDNRGDESLTDTADLNICVIGEGPPGGGDPPADLITAFDDDPDCAVEGLTTVTGNVLDNDTDSQDHDLNITHVNGVALSTLDPTPDGAWYEFAITDGTLKINAETGDFEFTYGGANIPVGGHWDGSFTYTVTDGDASDDSAESDYVATVDLCVSAAGGSPGYWQQHDGNGPQANDWDIAQNTSFETYFGVSGPYSGQWDIVNPVNGSAGLTADIALAQAFSIPQGGPGHNKLAQEATTALLNLLDEDTDEAFIDAYVYQRANHASTNADADDDLSGLTAAQILDDLKAQVQDAFNGAADAYTIAELTDLLIHTHE